MYIVSIALVLTLFSTVTQVFTAPVPRSSLISRSEDDSLLPRDEPSLVERHLSYEPLVARSHGDAEFEERSLNFFDPNDFDERSLDIEEPEELEKRSVFERRSLEGSAESRQMHKRGWFKNTFKKIVSYLLYSIILYTRQRTSG